MVFVYASVIKFGVDIQKNVIYEVYKYSERKTFGTTSV